MAGLGKGQQYLNGSLNTNIQSYSKNNRNRESSVAIDPSWKMLEEIEFHRLAKLRLEVEEPEEL
jgi:translation initiation factor 3 subunit D